MAVQSLYQQQMQPARKSRVGVWGEKIAYALLEYWALLITVVLGIIVSAAISVPFLSYAGLDSISKPIFYLLHTICAQIPSHSFYILGHQLGMCARNFSVYASMFVGALVFVISKKRLPGIPWWFWILLILPMAIDGLTQMVGWRESTWELRVLTGTLFGLGNMWFALPFIQKTLNETVATPAYPSAYIPAFSPVQYPPVAATQSGPIVEELPEEQA